MDPKSTGRSDPERQAALRAMLERIIEETLLLQEAAKQGVQVSDEEAGQLLKQLRQKFKSDEAMDAFLKERQTSIAIRKKSDREALTIGKLEEKIYSQIAIGDDAIEEYWTRAKPFLIKDMVKTRNILVETEAEATEIRAKLKQGVPFEDLARQYSRDFSSRERGGDIGWVTQDQFVDAMGESVFSLNVGEVSPALKSRFGYHLYRVDAKTMAADQTLDEHREHIRGILQQDRWYQGQRTEWVRSLWAKASISNRLKTTK
jgi:foldase protein PrsA